MAARAAVLGSLAAVVLQPRPGAAWPAPAAAGKVVEELRGISPRCQADLQKYLLCNAVSGLFTVCASEQLLSSATLQVLLGCAGASPDPRKKLPVCQKKCLSAASSVVNETVQGPCPADYQAMHGFSAPLNIFTVGLVDAELNISRSLIVPLPNLKGFGGPTMIDYGEPGKCAEIPSAQYCILSGSLGKGMLGTTFALGNCLPKKCPESDLRSTLLQVQGALQQKLNLNVQCGFARPLAAARGVNKQVEDLLGWGGIPVEYPNLIKASAGFWAMAGVCIALLLFVAAGTALDGYHEAKERRVLAALEGQQDGLLGPGVEAVLPLASEVPVAPRRGALWGFLHHWSLLRNGRAFLRGRPIGQDSFTCIDAIRTISMGQVILGHMYVYAIQSAGISNMEQFNPPYGLLGSVWFQVVPGCFYGVDSFFVLSGFLCAHGLERKVFSKPGSRSPGQFGIMYLQFMLHRYLRLVPLLMFCVFFSVYVLPQMGSGILWNMDRPDGQHCFDAAGGGGYCKRYWWTVLLFVQDLDRYVGKCFPHSWYLANDFQLYLTAPLFALAYSLDKRLGWALLSAGLVAGIVVSIAMTAHYHWVPEMIAGATKGFAEKFYFKPWCRSPAFLVGIATGWLWSEVFVRYKGRHTTLRSTLHSYALALLGVGLCLVAIFGRVAFFQCDILTCFDADTSPVSRFLQYLWGGFSILTWCVGLSIIMVLCFQERFLPGLQGFLHLSFWQAFGKLSYAAYLIHTSVLILNYCQRDRPIDYSSSAFTFNFVSFVVTSLLASLCLYLLVEKPVANLQAKLLGRGGGG